MGYRHFGQLSQFSHTMAYNDIIYYYLAVIYTKVHIRHNYNAIMAPFITVNCHFILLKRDTILSS